MLNYLKRLQDERDSLTQTVTSITEQAATEERDVTETERASIGAMAERCATIDGQLVTFAAQVESQRNYANLRGQLSDIGDDPEPPARREREQREHAERARGWGELFVTSAQFREYKGRGSSDEVIVPGLFTRAPIFVDPDLIGQLQPSRYTPAQPTQTTPLLDAVNHTTTANNMVEWFEMDTPYPLAGVVPEGELKPEAAIGWALKSGALKTYAHYKALSRQALEDVPQIQSIVEGQLRGGIYAKLEADVAAALEAAILVPSPIGAGGMLAAIRVGIALAQTAGFPNANSVVLNPTDWAELDLAVMAGTSGGPVSTSAFWGLHPIPSAAVPAGTAYVGDVKAAVNVYDRGQAAVYLTDSHADYFIRNMMVVLAETRALPIVEQPAALVKVGPAGAAE